MVPFQQQAIIYSSIVSFCNMINTKIAFAGIGQCIVARPIPSQSNNIPRFFGSSRGTQIYVAHLVFGEQNDNRIFSLLLSEWHQVEKGSTNFLVDCK